MIKQYKHRGLIFLFSIAVFSIFVFTPTSSYGVPPDAQGPLDSAEHDSINLLTGELAHVKVHSLTRLSITSPDIADVANATEEELLIVAKNVGQTVFFIWDELGKRTFIVRVYGEDLLNNKKRIEGLLKKAEIEGLTVEINPMEAKIVITGKVLEKDSKEYTRILERFSGSVLDFTESRPMEDLVEIDMQVAEINTTLQKSLGIDWTTGSNSSLIFTYPETLPTSPQNGFERILEIGEFNRTSTLLATVNALLQEGRGRVLSKPKLVVKSGDEASFQVGGQIPIRTTTTSSGGTSTENVSFKDFGILMSITPTIVDNKVDIQLSVEISEIDAANSTDTDSAFTTRTASTTLLLDDQQTIILAGLIKRSTSATIKKVPFLGDIPIIGMAFRSRSQATPDQETEVVISLTPTIIRQKYDNEKRTAHKSQLDILKGEFKDDLLEMANIEEKLRESESLYTGPDDSDDFDDMEANELILSDVDDEALIEEHRSDQEVLESLDVRIGSESVDITSAGLSRPDEKPAEPFDTDISQIMAEYIQSIQEKISQAISYPFEAAEQGWEGTVKLTLTILQDGTLEDVEIKESSGHEIFDVDAVNTTHILAPFMSFPPELSLEEIIVTIPIVYSQDSAALTVAACHINDVDKEAKLDDHRPFVPGGHTYAQVVQEKIAGSAIYPEEAKKYGWEGTVKLNLHILRDGTLDYALIKESSGYDIFDQCALQTAKLIAPYSVFPSESQLEELDVTIPIVYSLSNK